MLKEHCTMEFTLHTNLFTLWHIWTQITLVIHRFTILPQGTASSLISSLFPSVQKLSTLLLDL